MRLRWRGIAESGLRTSTVLHFVFGDQSVRQSRRLGKTILDRAVQHDAFCHGKVDQMPDAHVYRLDPVAGSQHGSDSFALVFESRPGTSAKGGRSVCAREATLGAPDRGQADNDTNVARKAESARMRQSLPIADQGVGDALQFAKGCDDRRRLDRKSTRLNSSHTDISRMPSSA